MQGKDSAIVNFASGAGTDGLPKHGPYAAAKHAVVAMSQSIIFCCMVRPVWVKLRFRI